MLIGFTLMAEVLRHVPRVTSILPWLFPLAWSLLNIRIRRGKRPETVRVAQKKKIEGNKRLLMLL